MKVKTYGDGVSFLVRNNFTDQRKSHVSFVLKKFPDSAIEVCISVLENDQRVEEARAITKSTPLNTS